jgi:hypothetical protein
VSFGRVSVGILAVCLVFGALALAQVDGQQSSAPTPTVTVPRLIRIQGAVRDEAGKPLSGRIGIAFALYKDEFDQELVWQENQNVELDSAGRYDLLLGAATDGGVPLGVFSAGEARWLGVRPEGQPEQPRILLLSVPYALKAADTEMLGGKPASAFVLAGSQSLSTSAGLQPGSANSVGGSAMLTPQPETACTSITSDGTATANQVTKFTSACNIENSAIFESGGNVGIGNTSPGGTLDVTGTAFIRGLLSAVGGAVMPPSGTATTSTAFISEPLDIEASVFNTTLSRAVPYIYQWQAEPQGNDTTNTGASLNLLYGVTGSIGETGLSIGRNGILTFASGQTFPGVGTGTVTSVDTGAGLTGGPITTSGTISIPSAGVTNAMLANSSVTVTAGTGLSGGGKVALGGTITLTNSAPSSGGTVTSVGTGTGLTGGPITTSGTLSLNTSYTDGRYLQLSGGTLTGGLTGTTGAFTSGLAATTGAFSSLVTEAGALLPDTGTATAKTGFDSNPLDLQASSFNSTSSSAVTQDFRWMAEPAGNDTSTPSGTLNLLYGSGGSSPAETGLSIASNGVINFASAQTFPGSGGTVTSVGTGAGLTGGPITKSGTISIPSAGVTNSMLANNSITITAGSGLQGGGTVALGGTVTLTNASSGGTVTSVNTGAGLTGGPITTTGTISIPAAAVTNSMLTNSAVTVLAGSGLSGGGTVALGGTVTLSSNLSGTQDGLAYFSTPTNLVSTAAPTNGQILIGSTGSAPVLGTLTAGQNVTITNSPGAVTISASSGGSAPVLPFFVTGGERTGANLAAVQNVTKLWGILLPYNVTTTEIIYDVTTADNTANDYDIGIFNNSGSLVADLGPTPGTTFAPAKGFHTLKWTQGSTALSAGRYYLAFTTNCASGCVKIAAATTFVSFAINASAGASAGGALPSTITPPADAWSTEDQPTIVIQ